MNASNYRNPGIAADESDVKSIRIRPELRAAQVKRSVRMVPALTMYFDEKYDLGETPIPDSFRKVTLIGCLLEIARSKAQILRISRTTLAAFRAKKYSDSGNLENFWPV